MTTIVVSGAIANKYRHGGEAWVRLSWIRGFQQLGCRAYFLEQIDEKNCVDEQGGITRPADAANVRYLQQIAAQFGLQDRYALIDQEGRTICGMPRDQVFDIASSADLLVNISGHLSYSPLFRRFQHKAYIDIDPGFTQFWQAASLAGARLSGHDFFFTIGENIGTTECSIPTGLISWLHTRQPVVLDDWPMMLSPSCDRFTTVASWRGPFGPVTHGGKNYGLKVHEFRKFLDLPERLGAGAPKFEIALNIHPADQKDRDELLRRGWVLSDPVAASEKPDAFRNYVQQSAGEFSVAQGVYVDTRSGWFSDRTVRYLASGKPALVQETGASRRLPIGKGLVTFSTLEEAVAGAREIASDYSRHARAARQIAEQYFDARIVLRALLANAGMPLGASSQALASTGAA